MRIHKYRRIVPDQIQYLIIPMDTSFETARLILRPASEDDAAFMVELFNTPKWLAYIGDRNVRTIEQAKAYVKTRITKQFETHGFATYTVIRKSDGAKLGNCGLYDREGVDGIDIGFAFLPAFEGQGYAYEASVAIRDAAFEQFGLDHIRAITVRENMASQKLLEKLGLTLVGTTTVPGDDAELLLYELHATDKS
jgi:RimJ/RimL family protein N-acetyltransferase